MSAKERVLDAKMHHLRLAGEREWSDLPKDPEAPNLILGHRLEDRPEQGTLLVSELDLVQLLM